MRVIEPKSVKHSQVYRKHSQKRVVFISFVVLILGFSGLYLYMKNSQNNQPEESAVTKQESVTNSALNTAQVSNTVPTKFKQFTGQEFKDLYYTVAYPNTQQIIEPFPITGNDEADNRIRALAEARGYKQTVIPQGAIVKINEPGLNGDDLLQPLAAEGWEKLKQAATKDGIPLSIVSAYRSPKWQRDLFVERLFANGTNPTQVAAGIGDNVVNATLSSAAVPGYSRHHTGYTIDLWCEDSSGAFAASSCYQWISKDNYLKAKQSGWIPSYPEGTDLQGPEPEPWEFVWVGIASLGE